MRPLKRTTTDIYAVRPNWSSEVSESFEFETDVFRATNGREQRWSARRHPRVTVSFAGAMKSLLASELLSDALRSHGRTVLVPCEWRSTKLAASALQDATEIVLAGAVNWIMDGGTIILKEGSEIAALTVTSVSGTTVTLDTLLPFDVSAAATVMMAYETTMGVSQALQFLTSRVNTITPTFYVRPGTFLYEPGVAVTTFAGFEVFDIPPQWGAGVEITLQSSLEMVDFGIGVTSVYEPEKRPFRVVKFDVQGTSQASAKVLLDFFFRQQGKRGAFWVPTQTPDAVVAVGAAAGSSTLFVQGTGLASDFAWLDGDVSHMAFKGPSGFQIREVSAMVVVGDTTEITFSSNSTDPIPEGASVSWCTLARFATDEIELNWITAERYVTSVSFQTLIGEE